jgi:hypothetical protein
MERDKGIEPSPPPWQGGVLPLYESRMRSILAVHLFIACSITASKSTREIRGCLRSIDLDNAGALDDRRFFLPLGEMLGALAVDINPCEFFTVVVVDSHLPMAVLSPAVLVESGGIPSFLLAHDNFAPIGVRGNIASSPGPRK